MNVGTHGQFLWQISPELCEGETHARTARQGKEKRRASVRRLVLMDAGVTWHEDALRALARMTLFRPHAEERGTRVSKHVAAPSFETPR
jgi:hypothetical protein